MIEVRTAIKEDMNALAVIQAESWENAFGDILSEETIRKYTDLKKCVEGLHNVYESKQGTFYIAFVDGKPFAELFWRIGEEIKDSAEIVALHSKPESWGIGVGKKIMERALLDISEQKFKMVYLWVFTENHRARKFYEKCGYVQDGEKHVSRFDNAEEVRYVYHFM